MGAFCTPQTMTLPSYQETVEGTELPSWVSAGGRELYEQARNIAQSPFPQYMGDRTATYEDISGEEAMQYRNLDTRDTFDPFSGKYYFGGQEMADKEAYETAREEYFTPFRTGEIDFSNVMDRPEGGFGEGVAAGLYRDAPDSAGVYSDSGYIYDAMGKPIYALGDSEEAKAFNEDPSRKAYADQIIPFMTDVKSYEDLEGGFQDFEAGMGVKRSRLTPDEQRALATLRDTSYEDFLQGKDLDGDGTISDAERAESMQGILGTIGKGYLGTKDDGTARTYQDLYGDLLGGEFTIGEGTEAQKYMDIYSDAIDPAVRDIQRRTAEEQKDLAARAAQMGAFGGSRMGIQQALLESEGIQGEADLRKTALADALGFAAGRFDADRLARMDADAAARAAYETEEKGRISAMDQYKDMALTTRQLQEQQAQGLITAGEAQRLLDQKALDIAYADYLDQREYPQEMLNFALGALQGVPYETLSKGYRLTEQDQLAPSVYGQAVGGLGAIASL